MNNIFNNGIFIGLFLAFVDIISMGTLKEINLGLMNKYWLPFICILYGYQMLIFNYGLKITSMSVLNLSWNLFSNIVITSLGVFYFKENISNLEQYGIFFGLFSLFLFSISQFQK